MADGRVFVHGSIPHHELTFGHLQYVLSVHLEVSKGERGFLRNHQGISFITCSAQSGKGSEQELPVECRLAGSVASGQYPDLLRSGHPMALNFPFWNLPVRRSPVTELTLSITPGRVRLVS